MSVACRFVREMGLTHREFFRELPAALAPHRYRADGNRVRVCIGRGSLLITLGSERTRSIAALRLPCTAVDFAFEGVDDDERERFMWRFDLCFRRGGG